MSRTYRRRNGPHPWFVEDLLRSTPIPEWEYLGEENGKLLRPNRYSRLGCYVDKHAVFYEGYWYEYGPVHSKKVKKKLAHYHSDAASSWNRVYGNDSTKFTRKAVQRTHRASARTELNRFYKNDGYEVIIPRKGLLPWG